MDAGDNWRVNLSVQDLKRLAYLSYTGEDRYFDGRKLSAGTSVDYLGLNSEWIKKIGLAAVYSDTDDHSFGLVGHGSSETADIYREWQEYLYFQGSENLRARLYSDIKLADNWKLTPTAGVAYRAYNDLGTQFDEKSDESETRPS